MDECIFCKIVKDELPAHKVWEDKEHLAFLSIFPIKTGHTLVIPKKHLDYVFDLEDNDLSKLMLAAKKVAETLRKAFRPSTNKIGVMIAGLQVLHAHIHLIPMDNEGELTFSKAHPESKENLQGALEKIKKSLDVS